MADNNDDSIDIDEALDIVFPDRHDPDFNDDDDGVGSYMG